MTIEDNDNGAAGQDAPLSEEAVLAFLNANPDFLLQHPEVLAPDEPHGKGVESFLQAGLARLRERVAQSEGLNQQLLENGRDNLTTLTQIHECVLQLLAASSFEELAQVAVEDLSIILNLDVVNLCVEAGAGEDLPVGGLQIIPPGTIDHLIPHNRAIVLRDNISGDPEIFGGAAPLIQSDALVRLDISPESPPAMLAFGSREPERFHHSQATELLTFLARALAELIRIFLGLPE